MYGDVRAIVPRGTGEYERRGLDEVRYLVIHHSGVAWDSSACAIARYHVDTNGWPGIGYHWVVRQNGVIYYCGDLETVRYNVAGRNREVVGICLTGDFTTAPPAALQLAAAGRLLRALRDEIGWAELTGHRDIAVPGYATACPGNTWEDWRTALLAAMLEG